LDNGAALEPGSSRPRGGPKFQDLTHDEAQRMQAMYARKRMMDRKIMYMKMHSAQNPSKDAYVTLKTIKQKEEADKAAAEGVGGALYPPPFMEDAKTQSKFDQMEDAGRLEELESRFRTRIRREKRENARLMKTSVPEIGGVVTDPIKKHVARRLVRQRTVIHKNLEEFLTRNNAQILYEFLQGVSVSIVKIRAKRPRATQNIFYTLTSDHDPEWVQRQLNILAPKLRSQLALKVNMGTTPNLRFVPYTEATEVRREYLWEFAKRVKLSVPGGAAFSETAQERDASDKKNYKPK